MKIIIKYWLSIEVRHLWWRVGTAVVGIEKSLSQYILVCQSECIDDEFQLFHICKSDIKEVHMVCDSNEMILYVRVTRKSLSDDWTKGWRGRERLRKEKSEKKRKKKTGHVVKKLNVNLLSVDVCEVNKRQIAREHWGRWVLGG